MGICNDDLAPFDDVVVTVYMMMVTDFPGLGFSPTGRVINGRRLSKGLGYSKKTNPTP